MDLENNIYKENNIKRELSFQLVEKINYEEIKTEKIKGLNLIQKQTFKNLSEKSTKHNKKEILFDILKNNNNRNRNLIKGIKNIKYFTQTLKNINLLLINFLVFINSFILTKQQYKMRKYSFSNEITIKINGTDIQNILNENFFDKPNEIYIEGNSYLIDAQNRIINLTNYENNITLKWNYTLTDCTRMFYGLSNLKEIDLTYFDLSQVTAMNLMFGNCYNLEYIKFNNSLENKLIVCDMSYIFQNCRSLKYVDLSYLDTSQVINMMFIFVNCSSLTSINFNGFNTSSVDMFIGTFSNCISLKSLNLSSFDTSNVKYMNSMFYNCRSLTSLNLSNFKTSKLKTMAGMFVGCSKLISLDLSNFDTSLTESMSNLFYNCSELVSLDISNFNTTLTEHISDVFYNCNKLKYINISNYIGNINISDINFFEEVPENITYCFNSENEIPEFISQLKTKKCSINDCLNDWKIKQRKIIYGKDICVYDCSLDNEFKYEFKNTCYNDCPKGTYLSNENNKCLIICREDFPFEKNEECIANCNAQDFLNNICKINNQNINSKQYMINTIKNKIIDGSVDLLLSKVLNENKKDYFINNNNTEIIHLTSLYNQRNNEYNNVSKIDIGECEYLLKEIYEIENNETLILFKIDFYIENYSIPITEYEIFHPQTKKKLDLNYCNQTKIIFTSNKS